MEASKTNVSLEPCEGGGRDFTLNRKRHWKHSVTAWDHLLSAETLAEATNKHDTPVKMTWPDFKRLGKKAGSYIAHPYIHHRVIIITGSLFSYEMIKFYFFQPLVIVIFPKCSIRLTPEGLFFLYFSITFEAWIMWSFTIFLLIPKTKFLYLYVFHWQTIIMVIEWRDGLAWIYSFILKPFNSYPSARRNAKYKRKF